MAALRAGFAKRARRPRFDPRPDLQARRHAGGVGGPGRLGARTQIRRAQALAYVPRSTTANCEMNQLPYQRSTQGIGIRNPQPIANTMVRHSTSSPDALKVTSRRVPSMLRQIQRIHAVITQA